MEEWGPVGWGRDVASVRKAGSRPGRHEWGPQKQRLDTWDSCAGREAALVQRAGNRQVRVQMACKSELAQVKIRHFCPLPAQSLTFITDAHSRSSPHASSCSPTRLLLTSKQTNDHAVFLPRGLSCFRVP